MSNSPDRKFISNSQSSSSYESSLVMQNSQGCRNIEEPGKRIAREILTTKGPTTTAFTGIGITTSSSSKNSASAICSPIFIGTPTASHDRHHLAALNMTTSGIKLEPNSIVPSQPTSPIKTTQQTINELRKISGLTWDQLSQLFDVSRRSIHFWASGQQLSSKNEAKLNRILDTVRYISRGSASLNRSLLMGIAGNGKSHLELLRTGEYQQVKDSISQSALFANSTGNTLSKLKATQTTKEKPSTLPNPGDLVDALQDSIHHEVGRPRPAKSVRSKKNSAQQ
jgi:DNA-binding transcriptional regulator YiaG